MPDNKKFIKYPVYHSVRLFDRIATKARFWAGYCPVCDSLTLFLVDGEWLRETLLCVKCKSTNRQRQVAYIVCSSISALIGRKLRCLKEIASLDNLTLYNTEATGAVHNALSAAKHYTCSEYFGPAHKSGDHVNGILHEDLMELSFEDETFDLVLSADILEHVPDPYQAHKEIHRVLKTGGSHIFTVPFYQTEFLDERSTILAENGRPVFLKEPVYHHDPLRPEGALVYTIFSLEMLVELRRIGFRTNLYHLYKPWYGILGSNAIVFEAIKV